MTQTQTQFSVRRVIHGSWDRFLALPKPWPPLLGSLPRLDHSPHFQATVAESRLLYMLPSCCYLLPNGQPPPGPGPSSVKMTDGPSASEGVVPEPRWSRQQNPHPWSERLWIDSVLLRKESSLVSALCQIYKVRKHKGITETLKHWRGVSLHRNFTSRDGWVERKISLHKIACSSDPGSCLSNDFREIKEQNWLNAGGDSGWLWVKQGGEKKHYELCVIM